MKLINRYRPLSSADPIKGSLWLARPINRPILINWHDRYIGRTLAGGCGCARVCASSLQLYVWDEFSECLLETRVLTSADFNTYSVRFFFISMHLLKRFDLENDIKNSRYNIFLFIRQMYVHIHHISRWLDSSFEKKVSPTNSTFFFARYEGSR